jgi:curved DNA-binding protein CbpA
MQDFYKLLQVDCGADAEVIRAAYRILARKHHPDVGGSIEHMTEINRAYGVLSDPASRATYDRVWRLLRAGGRWDAYANSAEAGAYGAAQAGPTRLEFGRYAGWTITDVAAHDPDFLEWFARTPQGRRFRTEIDEAIRARWPDEMAAVAGSGLGRGR